ncbi:MAG: LemA family protein [Lachnospiraceae bacterium]|nr:LemA family protein [Lachnospiraceae bacterium]
MKEKGNGKIGLIIVIAVLAIALIGTITTYNGMVNASEKVENASADIGTQLQRRADLIPNLVNAVKGYMDHETEVINSITESREKLINAGSLEEKAEANDALTQALSNFNVIVENYPDLKSNTNFIQLQDELAGTENRIATARRDYNDAVRSYNGIIKRIPGRFLAGMFGFEQADYFEAREGSEAVPTVEF